ncbi:bifunctional folylpolyglutamate synthase/dihydrofolate synthase [Oricola cellulosilytica]|uniref:Dihydrofolate synthase/folylpolyglutamate synthase n=1 Tax=Oricola cellulosilytica TaxID=1429082 RepID=A0A4R0PNB2_9HYPH|nr:folylpolyglutamate synthase/dihydrofolate synthase family protein [Oricola cellulosilytica]TCD16709.1 bifunctional folylpolyglutamate synthase/dihydrofolate synthase [Oricola cellulosilytica]
MDLHPKGFDLSLDRITRLLARLDNPQKRMPPVIHIAGTNGKGSCAALCRALLEASGRSVHVHTSPHLVRWHERYRIGRAHGPGEFVDDAVFADAIRRVADANGGEQITVFEILTAVMFVLFSEHSADAAIVEVGLGGRFDATNVIDDPAVSVIMPIGLDHEAYLGDRIELIAMEKAGIMKPGRPVVIGFQDNDIAREVLADAAGRLGCPAAVYGQDFYAYEEHGRMAFQSDIGLMDLPMPRLAGRHQISNAAAALAAVSAAGFDIAHDAAEQAMENVQWPARMQRLTDGNLVALLPEGSELWLDGGHNPHAAQMIAEALANMQDRAERPVFLVTGMIDTKDARGYFRAFEGMVRHVFTVPVPESDAGIDPKTLAEDALEAGLSAQPMENVAEVLRLLGEGWNRLEPAPRVLIGGSLYLAGGVLRDNGTPPV